MKKTTTIFALLICCNSLSAQINEVNKPIRNFEKLWSEFNLRYANFELKEIDWNEIYSKYRPLISEHTNNRELFEVCCSMLQELNDGHVSIEPDFEEEEMECGPPYEFSLEKEFNTGAKWKQFESVMNKTLQKNGFSKANKCKVSEETNFQYSVSELFGYLRIDEMTEQVAHGKFTKALDKAINKFENKQGLIIDLRFNGGGWDLISFKLASRLIQNERLGHYKKTRKKGTLEFTELKYKEVKSEGKIQFTKPIVILTSDFTASAAEVFLLLVKDLPYVTTIGDTTEGIFSDMYEFKLPNKWEVSLSHQQFFSKDMVNYEGIGIKPIIQIMNKKEDLENQNDPVIEAAIEVLKKESNR